MKFASTTLESLNLSFKLIGKIKLVFPKAETKLKLINLSGTQLKEF